MSITIKKPAGWGPAGLLEIRAPVSFVVGSVGHQTNAVCIAPLLAN